MKPQLEITPYTDDEPIGFDSPLFEANTFIIKFERGWVWFKSGNDWQRIHDGQLFKVAGILWKVKYETDGETTCLPNLLEAQDDFIARDTPHDILRAFREDKDVLDNTAANLKSETKSWLQKLAEIKQIICDKPDDIKLI
jgi:hypothetical protein